MEGGAKPWSAQDYSFHAQQIVAVQRPTDQHQDGQTERKRRRRFRNGGCQVPGCDNALQLSYHKKYHICKEHFSAPCVALEGINCRFCQKCGRFQLLDAFDDAKRTCRVALETHNARRRKRGAQRFATSNHSGGSGSDAGAFGSTAEGAHTSKATRSGGSGSGATLSLPCNQGGGSASPSPGGSPLASPGAGAGAAGAPAAAAAAACPAYFESGQEASAEQQYQPPSQPPSPQPQQQASPSPPQQEQQHQAAPQQQQQHVPPSLLPQPQAPLPPQLQQHQPPSPPPPPQGTSPKRTVIVGAVLAPQHPPALPILSQATCLWSPCANGSGADTMLHSPTLTERPESNGAPGSSTLLADPAQQLVGGAALCWAGAGAAAGFPTNPSSASTSMSMSELLSQQQQQQQPAQMAQEPSLDAWHQLPNGLLQGVGAPQALNSAPWGPVLSALPAASSGNGSCGSYDNPFTSEAFHTLSAPPPPVTSVAAHEPFPRRAPLPNGMMGLNGYTREQPVFVDSSRGGSGGVAVPMPVVVSFGQPSLPPEPQSMLVPLTQLMPPPPPSQQQQQVTTASAAAVHTLTAGTPSNRALLLEAAQQAALAAPHAAVQAAAPSAVPYTSPAMLHRMSLKVFQCTPDELAPAIRSELEAVLQVAPRMVDAFIRPGCTQLTVDFYLPPEAAAAAAAAAQASPVARMLQALRSQAALGSAAGSAALLQWQGLAAAIGGGSAARAAELAAEEPRLIAAPACVAVPAPGQPWPLVELRLQPPLGPGGWDLSSLTVLCRQSGRHLPVVIWGTDGAAAQAASQACQAREVLVHASGSAAEVAGQAAAAGAASPGAPSSDEGSDGGNSTASSSSRGGSTFSGHSTEGSPTSSSSGDSGSSGFDDSAATSPTAESAQRAAPRGVGDGSGSGGSSREGLWVRPVGLHPGSCELEVELRGALAHPAAAAAAATAEAEQEAGASQQTPPACLLSSPAPLLVLRDCEAAAEVQSMVQASGRTGCDDLLRDIGLAASFLEEVRQAGHAAGANPASSLRAHRLPPSAPLPPGLVAEVAQSAAGFAQRQGLPALERMLRRAQAAAAAAAAGADRSAQRLAMDEGASTSAPAHTVGSLPAAGRAAATEEDEKADMQLWVKSGGAFKAASCESDPEAELVKWEDGGSSPSVTFDFSKAEGFMLDKEEFGEEGANLGARVAPPTPECLPCGAGLYQALPVHLILRLSAALAAFYLAVLLCRAVPLTA